MFDKEFQAEADQFNWYVDRGYAMTNIPARLSCTGRPHITALHQLIMNLFFEQGLGDKTYVEYGYEIDHKDNNKLDNRICNLQYLPKGQNNNKQAKAGRTSRYIGVSWYRRKGKWHSQITIDGRLKHLGLFCDEQDAARAYNKAAKDYGVDRTLNNVQKIPIDIKR